LLLFNWLRVVAFIRLVAFNGCIQVMIECNLRAPICNRLKQARAALGLTQKEWCAASGLMLPSLKKYEEYKSLPGAEALSAYARAGIRVDWLLTGEGPMLLSDLLPAMPVPPAESAVLAQPAPASPQPVPLNTTVLATCLRAVLDARPDASPGQIAQAAADVYARLMAMPPDPE
jgi:transcriptional regulator with XRE-family HTH domain